ncbi:MAG: serine/threonine-protein kinase [Nannocystaceae bacterium]
MEGPSTVGTQAADAAGLDAAELDAVGDDEETEAGCHCLHRGELLAGRYKIVRRISTGGMGEVYLAEHIEIEKHVALKLLGKNFAERADLVERFVAEARVTSRIKHPNVIDITDFGRTGSGVPFFAMEYLEGEELVELIEREAPLAWQRALKLAMQSCEGLRAAHQVGVIHRDIKPENCYLVQDASGEETIKILDFGIAKSDRIPTEQSTTLQGLLIGTAAYMSPEQARGRSTDARSDLYSLGIILYEMLVGQVPFVADDAMDVLSQHLRDCPPRLSQVDPLAVFPDGLEDLVLKALEKDPKQRYESAAAFADAMGCFLAQHHRSGPQLGHTATRPPPTSQALQVREQTPPRRDRRRGRRVKVAIGALFALGGILLVMRSGLGTPQGGPGFSRIASVPDHTASGSPQEPSLGRFKAGGMGSSSPGGEGSGRAGPDGEGPGRVEAGDVPPMLPTVVDAALGSNAGGGPGHVVGEGGKAMKPPETRSQQPARPSTRGGRGSARAQPKKRRRLRPRKKSRTPKRGGEPTPDPLVARTEAPTPAVARSEVPTPALLALERQLAAIELGPCREKGGLVGMKIRANLRFDASGAITRIQVLKPFRGSALDTCIVGAVRRAGVRATHGAGEVLQTYDFRIRE